MKINLQANADYLTSEYSFHHFAEFAENSSPNDTLYFGDEECYEKGLKLIRFNDDGGFDEAYARKKKNYKKWKDYDSIVWVIRTRGGFVFLTDKNEFYRTMKVPFGPVHVEPMELATGAKLLSEVKPDELVNSRYQGAKWWIHCEGRDIPRSTLSLFERVMLCPTGNMKLQYLNLKLEIKVEDKNGGIKSIPDAVMLTMLNDEVIVTSLKEGPILLKKDNCDH
ncbi:hypothetical protein IKF25_03700 [Candidatus Saccharibacteria bacterium]|nr:hypothetical protein [Candidatus Saccharibacteria bacterium]